MRAVVIGAGEVGINIVRYLAEEGHDVVVVDNDPERLSALSSQMDVHTVQGMGSQPQVLRSARVQDASLLVAVTHHDEVNMVACQMAHSLFNVPTKIARVRQSSYLELTGSDVYSPEHVPIDMIISPEREIADTLVRTMAVPGAFECIPFANGRVQVVGAHVAPEAKVLGQRLDALQQETPFAVLGLFRSERLVVPTGRDHLEAGDEVFITCPTDRLNEAMLLLGHEEKPLRRLIVLGGGNIGFEICRQMEKSCGNIRVLEQNAERCSFLAEELSHATVLHGDALNRELLKQENIAEMDLVLAVTSDDRANMLSSLLAKQLGAQNVITLLNQTNLIPLAEQIELERVISPRQITASKILQHIRRGRIHGVLTVHDGMAEVLEFEVRQSSAINGVQIADLNLPPNTRLGAVIKSDNTLVEGFRRTVLQPGDHAILFTSADHLHDVEALF